MEPPKNRPIEEAPLRDREGGAPSPANQQAEGPAQTEKKGQEPPPSAAEHQRVQPIRAATWQDLPAKEAWCPAAMRPLLPWISQFNYEDNREESIATLPGWRLLAATRRGKLHANYAAHREDAYATMEGKDFLVLVVSDGAGSCQYSRIGSEFAVREVAQMIHSGLTAEFKKQELQVPATLPTSTVVEPIMEQAVRETIRRLTNFAALSGYKPQDFRCTLLVLVFLKWQDGGSFILGQVGDGFFAFLSPEGLAARLGKSDSGEYSGQVKTFVPEEDALEKFHESLIRIQANDVAALVLCSDGIEDPFYPIEKNATIIFRQLSTGVAISLEGFSRQETHGAIIGGGDLAEKALGQWLAFEKRGENDDRTILILHRDPFVLTPSETQTPS